MPPQFLYFDLGNVLLTFDNQRMCRQIAELCGVTEAAITEALMPTGTHADFQWRFESGLVSEEEYHDRVAKVAGRRPDRVALEHAASDMFSPIDATLHLAERLAGRGYRLGLLSNTNAFHWRFVMGGRYPTLNSAFEIEVTSFAAKAMKPDPRIYHHAVDRCGVDRSAVFFTDDRPENVAGARGVGLDAAPFVSAEQLASDLRARGVEVD
ncbi:MAG: HAD family phosphatase [Planctomycetota bacterium]